MSAPETTAAATPRLDVTETYRGALATIREGLGDLARDLKYTDFGELIGEGLVQILAGLRDLELLASDVELRDRHFVEGAAARRARSEAERESLTDAQVAEAAQRIVDRIKASAEH